MGDEGTSAVTGLLASLLETRASALADLDAQERLLVHSDLTGTRQLYELVPSGGLRQLTEIGEPVGPACYLPDSRRAAFEADRGGDERHQIYVVELDRDTPVRDLGEVEALTADPRYGHHLAGASPDGTLLAYTSNRRNGIDFDLWLVDLRSGEHRLLYSDGGWCQPASGFSPDGRLVSLTRPGPRPLDADLLVVDVASGAARVVLPHPDEAAVVGAPAWLDSRRFFVASDVGRDHAAVVLVDLDSPAGSDRPGAGRGDPVAGSRQQGRHSGGVDQFPVTSRDGSTVLLVENHGGESQLVLYATSATPLQPLGVVPLAEPGVVEGVRIVPPHLSADGARVYYTLSTPRLAGDVWCFDRASGETRRLTTSPAPVPAEQLATAERAAVRSFDGELVPLFLYRPDPESTPPVVVLVHGGPEGQSVLRFDPIVQGLVAEGYAVVVPNVRGSTGYGKRYASLDDTTKRLDSVADLAAVHGWLATAGLDSGRAALWGGSYGGYMVLAGLAFQPELWAAGVDIVGISDLVTFLTNTSDYRRAHRELEYGSLERDRAFLEEASPLRRADAIAAPLFVIHGRNDPRVPVSEAEQLVATLGRRGVRCELVVYEDEGHGLQRLANRLDAYPRAVAFLDEVLRPH